MKLHSRAQAQGVAKDVVRDQLAAPLVVAVAPAPSDVMLFSVLLESRDGVLTPRSTESTFRTDDRFRVSVIASRKGRIALYNTNPVGVFKAESVWRGEILSGQKLPQW